MRVPLGPQVLHYGVNLRASSAILWGYLYVMICVNTQDHMLFSPYFFLSSSPFFYLVSYIYIHIYVNKETCILFPFLFSRLIHIYMYTKTYTHYLFPFSVFLFLEISFHFYHLHVYVFYTNLVKQIKVSRL